MQISTLAVKKPATIFLFIVLIAAIGWVSYTDLPREATPDISWPHLYVTVPFPGATPANVEAQITDKLEQGLQNIEHLEEIKSISDNGYVTVDLKFGFGQNLDDARVKIREALDTIKPDMPEEVEDWTISEFNFSEAPIMTINLSSEIGLLLLKDVAEDLKDRIRSIPGILTVNRYGGLEKEVQIRVDPEKMQFYKLDLNAVSTTIQAENRTIPGGTMKVGPRELLINVPGEITSIDEIRDMIISDDNGAQIRIRDVADVQFTFKEAQSISRYRGIESVSLEVSKRTGENLIKISDQVKAVVKEFQGRYQSKITFSILNDNSIWVAKFVRDLENNIYTGMLFVFLVLFVFLGKRNAFFVGIAIPLSMLMSFMILKAIGINLNTIVLFSLITSLGMLVDNAIVIVENIYRHVQAGKGTIEAAIEGAGEVAMPVIASTLTTLLVFFPMIYMPGIMGEFMNYLPKTLIVTLTCSLVVGLVFNPVICSRLMKRPKNCKAMDETKVVTQSRFLNRYSKVLGWALDHPFCSLLIMAAFWLGMIVIYFGLVNPEGRTAFFPKEEPREAVIRITSPQGTILEVSDAIVKEVENKILPFGKYADSIVSNVEGTNSKITLAFPDWEKWNGYRPSAVVEEIRGLLSAFTGAEVRLAQQNNGPPVGREVTVDIRGEDLVKLKAVAEEVKGLIRDVKGLVNLETSADSNRSQIRIAIDRERIARHGLHTAQVASIIRTAFNGRNVSTYRVNQDEFDIVVRLDERFRRFDTDLGSLHIRSPKGDVVPLSELAVVSREQAGGAIHHLDLKRIITVEADSSQERSGAEVLKEVKSRLAGMNLPEGITIGYSGADKTQQETQEFLVRSFGIALFLIFVLLVTQFNSFILPFIILASVFASMAGVFLGMSIHGTPISVLMGGIGAISLAGIVVNNAIVLIDYTGQLREKGQSCREAVILAGMTRLRPIVLTAVTTILGLMPITIGMDIDFYRWPDFIRFGSEGGTFWKPMNLSIIYGLAVATFLTLFLIPVLYSLADKGKNQVAQLKGRFFSSEKVNQSKPDSKTALPAASEIGIRAASTRCFCLDFIGLFRSMRIFKTRNISL
ncbi:efflux RND transporter permease subunit [bacterium]|nr:efflux RND transporter permease subunit [bacterium]